METGSGIKLTSEDIEALKQSPTTVRYDPTGEMRWLTKPGTTTEQPRLQQKWRCVTQIGWTAVNVEEDWRDVPTVVA